MNYKGLNDYELVSRLGESEEITEILFNKYNTLIVGIAKELYEKYNRNTGGGLDLNDLIQEGMVGFSIALNTYNEHRNTLFFTYAITCIRTKILNIITTANRRKHEILNSSLSIDAFSDNFAIDLNNIISDKNENPEEILLDIENVNNLIKEMTKELTPFEEQVFDLKKSGFTYREIAEFLEVEPKSIDNAIQRIKAKLTNYLKKNQG